MERAILIIIIKLDFLCMLPLHYKVGVTSIDHENNTKAFYGIDKACNHILTPTFPSDLGEACQK